MKKHFNSKKKKKHSFFIWIIIVVCSYFINCYMLDNVSKSYLFNYDLSNFKIKFNKEKLLLNLGLNFNKKNKSETALPVFKEHEYLNKTIYLYNTHQTEEYKDGNLLDANKLIKEIMKEYNVDVIVEDTDIMGYIKKNNLAYKESYKVTRSLLEKKMNDNINLYIDLHRDSTKKSATTATIDGKNYAKIMFVVGGKNENYLDNYKLCESLDNILKNFNKSVSRGIYVRESSNYNQDLASNIILIELGGQENTMEEVNNTIHLLCDVLLYYIGE